jgi:Lipase (class 3)
MSHFTHLSSSNVTLTSSPLSDRRKFETRDARRESSPQLDSRWLASQVSEDEMFSSSFVPKPLEIPFYLSSLKLFLDASSITCLRNLYALLRSYGQGLALSTSTLASAFFLLIKFYQVKVPVTLSSPNKSRVVLDMEFLARCKHLYRYTIASYGWKGINYFGQGRGFIRDSFRGGSAFQDRDRLCMAEFLSVFPEDIIDLQMAESEPFKPRYFVVVDRSSMTLVLSIRGSLSPADWMTSLTAHYVKYKSGYAHAGFLKSAEWMKRLLVEKFVPLAALHHCTSIVLTGHSLGGAVAALTKILYDEDRNPENTIPISAYAFACPPILSQSIMDEFTDWNGIYSFIYGNDFAGRLCYGSLMDFRPLLAKAAEYAKVKYVFTDYPPEKLDEALTQLELLRHQIQNESTYPKVRKK